MKKFGPYIAFAVTAVAMLLIFPVRGRFVYKYQKGSPWTYETLVAPMDFPVLKTKAEILKEKEERASEIVDCYQRNEFVPEEQLMLFGRIAAEKGLDDEMTGAIASHLNEFYETGVVASFDKDIKDKVIFVKTGKRMSEMPAQEVYTIESAIRALLSDLAYTFPDADIDSVSHSCGLGSLIVPNLTYDDNTTQMLHKEAVDYVSPTKGMFYDGQLIVSKGEIVTADIEQILDSYKAEYQRSFGYSGSVFSVLLSHFLLILAVLAILFFTIYFVERKALSDIRQLIFFLLMAFLSFCACAVVSRRAPTLLPAVPFAVLALYICSFFDKPISISTYLAGLLPVLIIPDNGVELFFINAVAGCVAMFSFQRFSRGWMQFLNALFVFVAMFLVYIAFNMISDVDALAWRQSDIAKMAINAILVVVCYPFVFLLEKAFSFVSYSRLWELSDTNNALLREMARKAPGTFQHCLQVANLAENAARDLGAASMLARVGSLYHDIGKMENPSCFIENHTAGAPGYHDSLTPEASAHDIINHVDDGMAMARKYGLPEIVTDFIRTHHGRSRTGYFYNQYCNNGGDPANVAPFTYNGILPHSKEQAIVMIADAVEAASRTLKDYSEESISALVDGIVAGKVAERQFDDADISISEIGRVKTSLKEYLKQIYHARISYPKRKDQSGQE